MYGSRKMAGRYPCPYREERILKYKGGVVLIGFIYLCAVFLLVALFVFFFRDSGFDLFCATDWFFTLIIIVIVIFFVLFMFAFEMSDSMLWQTTRN